MKLVSVTIANNREDVIGGMVRSVMDIVDEVIIVDTGITDKTRYNATAAVADLPESNPVRVKFVEFPWVNDFAAARNAALKAAHEAGADWAVMLDTDEELQLNGENLRGCIEETPAHIDVLRMFDADGTYDQPRVFRIPVKGSFGGKTHEAYSPALPAIVLPKARFYGKPKTPEQTKAKLERDLAILLSETEREPTCARWWFYLGSTYMSLEKPMLAIEAFEKCSDLRGWNEESAWACFRAAACWCMLGQFSRAVDMCAEGLARHAGVAELAWLAGHASLKDKKPDQAVYWAKMSEALGCFKGIGATIPRVQFQMPAGQWEGPYEVLIEAYREIDEKREAEKAGVSFGIAQRLRLARGL